MINKYLNNNCYDPLFLIGSNGSGKTYTLKEYQDIMEGKSIYISEEGTLDVKMFRSNAIPKLETHEYLLYPKSKYYGETKATKLRFQMELQDVLLSEEFCKVDKVVKNYKSLILQIVEVAEAHKNDNEL